MLDIKNSLLVSRQVPEFVRDDYPLFVTFLEAYYEYLETKQGIEQNDLLKQAKDLRYISDVDYSIDTFENSFLNTYANLIPKDTAVDKAFLIKNVLPLYLAKGSEKSFKLLFRLLFNDEADIVYPRNQILRASDGHWVIDNILRIDTNIKSINEGDGTTTSFRLGQQVDPDQVEVYIDGVLQTYATDYYVLKENRLLQFNTAPTNGSLIETVYLDFDPVLLSQLANSLQIKGLTSGATAIIEKGTKKIISNTGNLGFPFELYINNKTLNGSFQNGEDLQVSAYDDIGNIITFVAKAYAVLSRILVVDGGASYNIGDPVIISSGNPTTDATAVVESVVSGFISKLVLNKTGAGFINGGAVNVYVSGVETTNLQIAIDGVDISGVANSTMNTYSVFTDEINPYANTNINAADYGFPSTLISTGENVATVIAEALTPLELTSLGPISNVVLLFSNTSLSITPTIDAYGTTYNTGNLSFSIKSFQSVGKIKINNGGTGYQVGDEVVVGANPAKTSGRGFAAAVKSVAANGAITQIEIQPCRVSGTANAALPNVIFGTASAFDTELRIGDRIILNNQSAYIQTIANATYATINSSWSYVTTNKKLGKYNEYLIGGQGYTQNNFPSLTISSNNISATGASIEIDSLMSDGEDIQPFIGNTQPGAIITIKMLDVGSGYKYAPLLDFTGYGDGTATGTPILDNSYISLPGRWTTSDSILSSNERKLEGRNYYVDYSYVTSATTEFSKYKTVLKQLLHPAGFVNYAFLNKTSEVTPNTITLSTSSVRDVGGTVNIANGSVYVTGINTAFSSLITNGVFTVNSNIAINDTIRTISNIISNTNLSVSVAFTSNANAQTVTILI